MRFIWLCNSFTLSFLASSVAFSGSVDPDEAVNAHNKWRNALNQGELDSQPVPSPFLTDMYWDESLAKSAQAHSDQCVFEHSGVGGENLYAHTGTYGSMTAGIDRWANEYSSYDYNLNQSIDAQPVGHYTQIVWHSSLRVGCAKTQCSPIMRSDGSPLWSGALYTCQYQSPGNWFGQKPYSVSTSLQTVVAYLVSNENLDLPMVNIDGVVYRIKMKFKNYEPPVFETLAFAVVDNVDLSRYPDIPYFEDESFIVPKLTIDGAGSFYIRLKHLGDLNFELVDVKEN